MITKIQILKGNEYLPTGTIGILLDYDDVTNSWRGQFPQLEKTCKTAFAAGRVLIGKKDEDFEVLDE